MKMYAIVYISIESVNICSSSKLMLIIIKTIKMTILYKYLICTILNKNN